MAAGSSNEGRVRIFEIPSGVEVRSVATDGGYVYTIGFDGDGRQVVLTSDDNGLRAIDLATGAVRLVGNRPHRIRRFAFSRDGKFMAAEGPMEDPAMEGRPGVVLWDVRAWKRVREIAHPIAELAFSRDGRHLAGTGHDGAVRIWEVASGREVACPGGPNIARGPLQFADDQRRLIVAGDDGRLHLFGPKGYRLPRPADPPGAPPMEVPDDEGFQILIEEEE